MNPIALPTTPKFQLTGISWETYESLLRDISQHRRFRLTYYRGTLDLMVPSPEHERYKKVIGRFVETLAEELEIAIEPFGSTTFKKPELAGVEPDECFYVRNLDAIRGLRRFDSDRDPPPDLAIEIDIASSSKNRLATYAEIGIAEVWRYDGNRLVVYQLENGDYVEGDRSGIFPTVPISQIAEFLDRSLETDYLTLVRQFQAWIRHGDR